MDTNLQENSKQSDFNKETNKRMKWWAKTLVAIILVLIPTIIIYLLIVLSISNNNLNHYKTNLENATSPDTIGQIYYKGSEDGIYFSIENCQFTKSTSTQKQNSEACFESFKKITSPPIPLQMLGPTLKPALYLYPSKTTTVTVKLNYNGTIIADYPDYDATIGGWKVIASPNGQIIDTKDNKQYSYIYWEGSAEKRQYDLSSGFVVAGKDSKKFLENVLPKIGLLPSEYNDFIVYWYPKMEGNKFNLIHFANDSEYGNFATLNITPKPDSLLRVFMVIKPIEKEVVVKPQTLTPFTRNGFTVVEWGGTELK
jgi:hypothetical protein